VNSPDSKANLFAHPLSILGGQLVKVQREGVEAFQSGNHHAAEMVLAKIKRLSALRDQIRLVAQEWASLELLDPEAEKAKKAPVKPYPEDDRNKLALAELEKQHEAKRLQQEDLRHQEAARKLVLDEKREREEAQAANVACAVFGEWRDAVSEILASDRRDDVFLTKVKSAMCKGRGIMIMPHATKIRQCTDQLLGELCQLLGSMDEQTDHFTVNGGNNATTEIWNDLSYAYEILGDTAAAVQILENHPDLKPRFIQSLLDAAGAGESYLKQLFYHMGVKGAYDLQQQELHAKIEQIAAENNMTVNTWQNFASLARFPLLLRKAEALRELIENVFVLQARELAKDAAFARLKQFDLRPDHSNIEIDAFEVVEQCLAAGIPASNKDLVRVLSPYRYLLEETKEPSFAPLIATIAKHQMLSLAKNGSAEDLPELGVEDSELSTISAELQEYLKGKTVLFVGGNKVHANRKKQLLEAIGAKELEWPDAEEDTNIQTFIPYANKADVVVQLIRWCRHSYKHVLDWAKAQGKETAVLVSGLGNNKVVYDLHTQLIARKTFTA
jgi:hypothetical protein